MIDEIDYNILVENALKNVIKEALEITAKHGLPGENHFYITYKTTHPDVSIPASIRAQHPEEMTIVMQHQFIDLDVQDDKFAVTLSFSGVNHRLVVPYESVISFADPFATFGLQFSHKNVDEETKPFRPSLKAVDDSYDNNEDDGYEIEIVENMDDIEKIEDKIDSTDENEAEAENNVVMLDAFRKNNV